MLAYQKRQLAGMAAVGEPGPLPSDLQGLADVSLADLNWTYEPLGYHGFGFFPVLAPIIPGAVKPLQMLKALRIAGIRDEVEAYVAAGDEDVQDAYNRASEFRRDSPLLNAAALVLFEDDAEAQLDALFTLAATIVE